MASKKKTTEEQLVKAHADAARRAAEAHVQLDQARTAEAKIEAKLVEVEAGDRPELIEQLIRARGAVAAMEAVVGQLDRRAADAEIAVAEARYQEAIAAANAQLTKARELGHEALAALDARRAFQNKRSAEAKALHAAGDRAGLAALGEKLAVAVTVAQERAGAAKGEADHLRRIADRALAELNAVREGHGLAPVDHRQAAPAPEAVEA